jgi:gliding motility-associated-like protein
VLSSSLSGLNYFWTGPAGFSSTLQAPFIPNFQQNNSGNYILTLSDSNSCVLHDTINVQIQSLPVFTIVSNSPLCPGDSLILLPSTVGLSYYWTGPDGISSTLNELVIPNFQQVNTGVYFLSITDSASCVLHDTTSVEILSLPVFDLGSDTTLCLHQSVTFDIDNGNAYTYLWNNGNNTPQNTVFTGEDIPAQNPFWVWASLTGCKTVFDSLQINVEFCDLEPSNVMTPNNDNINDVFLINGLEKFPGTELFIYSRWGKLVYKSSDYQNDWKGASCPDGVYYYIIRTPGTNSVKNEIKGWITIIGNEN